MTAMAIEYTDTEPPARRHPTLEVLCGRLEAIIVGAAAEKLLESPAELPVFGGIAVLPSWTWLRPLIDLGRKDKEYGTGEGLLMPVRNEWSGGPVITVGSEPVPLTYRTVGMGHAFAGQSKAVARAGKPLIAAPDELPSLTEPVFTGFVPRRLIEASLKSLADAGKTARWEIIRELEPRVLQTIHKAHSAVSHEIGLSTGIVQPMLDETGLEEVLAVMMYGFIDETGRERPGSVFRLLNLCQSPSAFVKVDPLRYIAKHLRRDAESAIRKKLGDPHIGPKIREIARRFPNTDISVVVAQYRKVYPKDRLSHSRAHEALSVAPDVMAQSVMLSAESMRVETSEAKGTRAL